MPNGTVHSGCIDLTQATARLVIVLVSTTKERYWGQQWMERDISIRLNYQLLLGKMSAHSSPRRKMAEIEPTFRSDRPKPKWPDRSNWTTFKGGPEHSGRTKTEMVRSIWCTNRNFRNSGLNGKRPKNSYHSAPLFPKEMTLSGEFTRWSLWGLHGANN